jgi:hypothetical protein
VANVVTAGKQISKERCMVRNRMTTRIEENYFIVEFAGGLSKKLSLPDCQDKQGIKRLADEAVEFAISQGATIPGQVNAVRKGLTKEGYYITRARQFYVWRWKS